MCASGHRFGPGKMRQWEPDRLAATRRIKVEASENVTVVADRQVDWDRIGVVLVTFGIACSGVATVLYSVGFLIKALSHHV